jgi:DNA-binding response OmpR family regulator
MKQKKIFVIEDEDDILEVIVYNLKREGYSVISCRDGEEGLKKIKKEDPDLVLLDLMLPGLDGIELCRRLKADPATEPIPIIMVTAKGEESDIVLGLKMGADDYVSKPFSPKELLARIQAVLRRVGLKEAGPSEERISLSGLIIDVGRHEVKVDGKSKPFTATELRLLHYLASHPGRVFERDLLLNRAVGEGAYVIDRNIDVHIRSIRKKLGRHGEWIETVRGVGYRFKDGKD